MGPFSFIPFMQCYHGILSMDHDIEDSFEIDDEIVDFTKGRVLYRKIGVSLFLLLTFGCKRTTLASLVFL